MKYYVTDRDFKKAFVRRWGKPVSAWAWVHIKDFLFTCGIHPPCNNEEIDSGIIEMKKFEGEIK